LEQPDVEIEDRPAELRQTVVRLEPTESIEEERRNEIGELPVTIGERRIRLEKRPVQMKWTDVQIKNCPIQISGTDSDWIVAHSK